MARRSGAGLLRGFDRVELRRWTRAADGAASLDLAALRGLRNRALTLRRKLDTVIRTAETRLALPWPDAAPVPKPLHADWTYRPTVFSAPIDPPGHTGFATDHRLDDATAVFHDCDLRELMLRQRRHVGPDDSAPFALALEVYGFEGSFLSLVTDLPAEAMDGLRRDHLIGVRLRMETETPLEVFARLNIRHGPNTEQIVRELPGSTGEMDVEFDLAYTGLNERRVERAWLDLIFEGPRMNQITIADMTLSRRPRADL